MKNIEKIGSTMKYIKKKYIKPSSIKAEYLALFFGGGFYGYALQDQCGAMAWAYQ